MTLLARLTAKILKTRGCWEFTGAKNNKGYGHIGVGGRGTGQILAHRAAYECFVGPIPPGMFVLHHCDNPSCVNPDHLYVGTQKDNIRDAVNRGRHFTPTLPGEGNQNVRVTDKQVEKMRAEYKGRQSPNRPRTGPTLKELAAKYGISLVQTHRIVTGQSR